MLDTQTYQTERTICDKAAAYWAAHATFSKSGWSSMGPELSAHPDYAACTNDMRGRVELYELNRDKPAAFTAYVQEPTREQRDATNYLACRQSDVTTWTGNKIGTVTRTGPDHRNNFGARWRAITVRTIWGDTYHGRYYFDAQQCVNLRRAKHA